MAKRLDKIDWAAIDATLTGNGFAPLPGPLSTEECSDVISLYGDGSLFRSRIEMERFRFGRGEYKYFSYPLPAVVEDLLQQLYPRLAPISNAWAEMLGGETRFPSELAAYLE